jgi:hypothetical protein
MCNVRMGDDCWQLMGVGEKSTDDLVYLVVDSRLGWPLEACPLFNMNKLLCYTTVYNCLFFYFSANILFSFPYFTLQLQVSIKPLEQNIQVNFKVTGYRAGASQGEREYAKQDTWGRHPDAYPSFLELQKQILLHEA